LRVLILPEEGVKNPWVDVEWSTCKLVRYCTSTSWSAAVSENMLFGNLRSRSELKVNISSQRQNIRSCRTELRSRLRRDIDLLSGNEQKDLRSIADRYVIMMDCRY